jgi:hypothetical protein
MRRVKYGLHSFTVARVFSVKGRFDLIEKLHRLVTFILK